MREITHVDKDWSKEAENQQHWCGEILVLHWNKKDRLLFLAISLVFFRFRESSSTNTWNLFCVGTSHNGWLVNRKPQWTIFVGRQLCILWETRAFWVRHSPASIWWHDLASPASLLFAGPVLHVHSWGRDAQLRSLGILVTHTCFLSTERPWC